MDRELSPDERRAQLARRLLPAGALGVVAVAALLLLPRLMVPGVERRSVRLARVERGDVSSVLEATGIVEPARERLLTSPLDARVLRVLRRPGDSVRAGDALLELDAVAAELELARLRDRIATLRLDLEQARLAQERSLGDLRSREESRRLEREVARARLARSQKLRSEGLVSDEQMDERHLELQRADIDVAHLAKARESEAQEGRARVDGLRLQLQQAEREHAEQARQLELASARAEEDGVVTWILDDAGATVRRGDELARLARLDDYHVRARLSDVHASSLKSGLPVRVRAPGMEIRGRVSSVHPAVEQGVISFVVVLDEPGHPGLRPSQRVDAWIVGEEALDVACLARPAGKPAHSRGSVFVIDRDGDGDIATRRSVSFGLAGPDRIEILEGLMPGDEVIVSDTTLHDGADRLRLR